MPGVSAGNLTVSVMHTISTLAAIASVGVYAKLPAGHDVWEKR